MKVIIPIRNASIYRTNRPTNRIFIGIIVIAEVVIAQAKIRIEAITHLKVIKVVIVIYTRVLLGKDSGFIYIKIARAI